MDFLISFDDLKAGAKALRKLTQAFTRAGANVASTDVDPKVRRTSGVNYRQVLITFTDNQQVELGVKTTGDIFEVRVNGSVLPIKAQSDQVKAVGEIAAALEAGRKKFQDKMARTKVALPKGITTAAPKMEERIASAKASLSEQIAVAKGKVNELRAELGEPLLDSAGETVMDAATPTDLEEVYIRGEKGVFYVSHADRIKDSRFMPVRDKNGKKIRGMEVHAANLYPSQAKADEASARVKKSLGLMDSANGNVLDSSDRFNPRTDHWVSTEKNSKLLIRDGSVIGGAGGKLNGPESKKESSKEVKSFPKDVTQQVKATKQMLREKPHTVDSLAKEAGINKTRAKNLLTALAAVGFVHDPTNNGRIPWDDSMKFHVTERHMVMDSVHKAAGEIFNGGEWDTLIGMKRHGKLEDGDVPSKADRDNLVERGFVERGDGMNWLTEKGKEIAAALDAIPYQGMKRTAFATGMADAEDGERVKVKFCLSDGCVWEVHDIGGFKTDIKADSTGEAFKLLQDEKKYQNVKACAVLDAVDVPTASFNDPQVVEAVSLADRVLAGDTLDDACLTHAIAVLQNALDTVETNYPINLAEGNIEQANLEEAAAEDFRRAIQVLETSAASSSAAAA